MSLHTVPQLCIFLKIHAVVSNSGCFIYWLLFFLVCSSFSLLLLLLLLFDGHKLFTTH